ncbi:hypothetical protein [Brevibacillus dissolubilis]|uniref:hypothetical protein n=1 Tax=Brevibacillus dissolubilis TaxID=1844116 RepID=UPI0011174FD6|nr:hypothetical protein [Brevibacillus dissolubilis]
MATAGNPILEADVSTYPEYQGKTITPYILGQVALNQKNRLINGVDLEDYATSSLVSLSANNGNMTATLIMIYNATGEDLTFVDSHDWSGHLGQSPFDSIIQNGQWSYFLHTHVSGTWCGSVGCCVYRGTEKDFFMGWSDPYGGSASSDGTYVEAREHGHWVNAASWDYMYNLVNNATASSSDEQAPYKIVATIGTGATPICKFIIQRTK